MENKCYCCGNEKQTTEIKFGTIVYNLCDDCLKDFKAAREEVDKLRK